MAVNDDLKKAIDEKLRKHDELKARIDSKLAHHDAVSGAVKPPAGLIPLNADQKAAKAAGVFGNQGMSEAASDMAKYGPIGGLVAAVRQVKKHPKAAYDLANYPANKSAEGLKMIAGALPDADSKLVQKGIQKLPEGGKFAANMIANAPKAAAELFGEVSAESISPLGIAGAAAPILKMAKRTGPSIEKAVSREVQLASGVQAKDAMRLIKKPGTLFTAKSKEEAGKAVGEAYRVAGLNPNRTAREAVSPGSAASRQAITVYEDLVRGDEVTDQSLLKGVKAWQYIIDHTPPTAKELLKDRIRYKEKLVAELSARLPQVARARSGYADAALAEKFKKLVPVNKDGSPSYMRSALGSIGSGLAGLVSLPVALGSAALQAPIVQGGLASAAGGALKLAKPVLKKSLFSGATNAALAKRKKNK